jgi:hypothetical protein
MTCSLANADVLNRAAEMAEAARDKTVRVRRIRSDSKLKSLAQVYIKCESLSFDPGQMPLPLTQV